MAQVKWFPDRSNWKDGVREGSQSIAFTGAFNLIREFWPGIRRALPFLSGRG